MSRNSRRRKAAWRKESLPLGWKLIEWRLAYYYPDMVHPKLLSLYTVPDWMFDQVELRYLELCYLLKKTNYNAHKIPSRFRETVKHSKSLELDFDRPSVQLICNKLSGREHPMTKFGGELVSQGKNDKATGGGALNIVEKVPNMEKTVHLSFYLTGPEADTVDWYALISPDGEEDYKITSGNVNTYYKERNDSTDNKPK